jgi:hypothetical protein
VVTDAKVDGDPDQVTVPVYPVPAVVVVTGIAPEKGAVTPAMEATEMTVLAGAEGATATGAGGGGGVAVVIANGAGAADEAPAALFAVMVKV